MIETEGETSMGEVIEYGSKKASIDIGLAFSITAIALSLAAAAFVGIETTRVLWPVTPGTAIRPMGLAMIMGMIGLTLRGVGVSAALVTIFRGWRRPRRWALGFLCILCALAPLSVFTSTERIICKAHGLVMED
jgi:hypothetical protein